METNGKIASVEELRELFGSPSGLAVRKCISHIDRHARAFIARSPFLCLSTADATGKADVSPRGDPPGFVQVLDEKTIAIPDRPGNNRLDTMTNIMANPKVGLIFFIPGIEETLRINGRAWLTRNAEVLSRAMVSGKLPKLAICVEVEELFFHCAKALKRSRLWDPAVQVERKSMPPLARIILEQVSGDGCADEREVEEREAYIQENYRTSLY